jgi:hypothetical protein
MYFNCERRDRSDQDERFHRRNKLDPFFVFLHVQIENSTMCRTGMEIVWGDTCIGRGFKYST